MNLAIWEIVQNADLVVTTVLVILIIASLICWSLIFSKRYQYYKTRKNIKNFLRTFWNTTDLVKLYTNNKNKVKTQNLSHGIEVLFDEGFREFIRLTKLNLSQANNVTEAIERRLRVAYQREVIYLNNGLATLATIGSISPYIGLFGTVWGIMVSFQSLSSAEQTTLASVAPGLAEALIATGMGLLAAIPAVVAYNKGVNKTKILLLEYELFADEFLTILYRQASAQSHSETTHYLS